MSGFMSAAFAVIADISFGTKLSYSKGFGIQNANPSLKKLAYVLMASYNFSCSAAINIIGAIRNQGKYREIVSPPLPFLSFFSYYDYWTPTHHSKEQRNNVNDFRAILHRKI
eukprot:m.42543 g.42543  ORF g.42543 m.42543 type:complete len:112 (-) comp7063_c0_seq4:1707-2042(-)